MRLSTVEDKLKVGPLPCGTAAVEWTLWTCAVLVVSKG